MLKAEFSIINFRLLLDVDGRLEVLRRWLKLIEDVLVDLERLRCPLIDGFVKALKTAGLLLARDVLLLLVVHLLHHWTLVHAVRLRIE
jgi:hypothetical protein